MKNACVFIIVINLVPLAISTRHNDCSLNVIHEETEKFSPLLLHNHTSFLDLAISSKGRVSLKWGEKITLSCPDPKNYLTATNSNYTVATCLGNNSLKIFLKSYQFEDLQCKKTIRGEIQTTGQRCGNDGERIMNIGYQIAKNQWITLIKVCYNGDKGTTLYTEHTLQGQSIKYGSKSNYRPSFSTLGLGPNVAASVAYKRAYQKSTFNKLLGFSKFSDVYINSNSFLSRGHLSPDADFLTAPTQYTTYYYVNTCPQWQVVNGGNWKSVENAIRKTAERYNDTFTIITGTYEVLSLKDINNNDQKIYLVSGEILPVPKYVWKIAYNQEKNVGIAFVVLNNPFVKRMNKGDFLCENICEQYGYRSGSWTDRSRGYVHCCDLKSFEYIFSTRQLKRCSGVLEGVI